MSSARNRRRTATVQHRPSAVDREKLRAAIRRLGPEYVFYMLDDAIDLLPPSKLKKLASKYLDLQDLLLDSRTAKKAGLLDAVRAFDRASRAGEYYEPFEVNSGNCTEQSPGTTAWIAKYNRLLERCAAGGVAESPTKLREAFEVLFGLLDYIDEANDDVLFFGDEGGSYAIGVDWERVLPPWFLALSETATPQEFAERISTLLDRHYKHGRDAMHAVARNVATSEQRAALMQICGSFPFTPSWHASSESSHVRAHTWCIAGERR
jgi:hypothetical protein